VAEASGRPLNPGAVIETESGWKELRDVEGWAELRREHFVRGVSTKEFARRTWHEPQHDPVGVAVSDGTSLLASGGGVGSWIRPRTRSTGCSGRTRGCRASGPGADCAVGRLQRIPLLIVDEVGYIPFDPQAANLIFMLVPCCYQRAGLIVTGNKPFSGWGEIFGDDVVTAAMIRLVHHAEILSLQDDSNRLRDRDLARPGRDD
jgi:hypothetical protein